MELEINKHFENIKTKGYIILENMCINQVLLNAENFIQKN